MILIADQEFGKAIQLIQYSLQYLQYSCKHLKTKKDTVTVNTKILKDENKALDLKLSILK